jgi:hypothetical protein
MGRFGSATAFGSEAALWVVGAALVASSAGMSWSLDLPKLDLAAPQSANPTLAASGSPAPSSTPGPTMSSVAQKMKAFFDNPALQFEAKNHGGAKVTSNGRTINGTITDTIAYNEGAASDFGQVVANGYVTSYDRVALGTTVYYRNNGSAWATENRPEQYMLVITLLWENRVFVDRGLEKKNGRQLHRIEATDTAALSADYQKSQAAADADMTLVYWTDNNGAPVFFNVSGTYTQVVKGVSTGMLIDEDWTVTKTSGVTITAPI